MHRRDLLKLLPSGAMGLFMSGLPVQTLGNGLWDRLLGATNNNNNNVIVFIQLHGGNDGLHTVIPMTQYDKLATARQNIYLPESKLLKLDGVSNTFHPSMTGLQNLYNNGQMNVVQGVSYPNPCYSHFRATDIWLTGSGADNIYNDGWLGRYLSSAFTNYPTGYPNSENPDPPAIEIGNTISSSLLGPKVVMGTAIESIDDFYNIISNTVEEGPATPAGHELTFIRYVTQQTRQYLGSVQAAAAKGKNLSNLYPANNDLADQLKIVSRLIAGGLKTRIYLVSLNGFDSHARQVDDGDHTKGLHATLLKSLSEAVSAFLDDCKLNGTNNRVVAVTSTEFGRRIKSNGSTGTDHGSATPMLFFGDNLNPGIIGADPFIPQTVTSYDNLEMNYDYRQVYASILEQWLGVQPGIANNILLGSYDTLPIFKQTTPVIPPVLTDRLYQNTPNPFHDITNVKFSTTGGLVTLTLHNDDGKLLRPITGDYYPPGEFNIQLTRDQLAAGLYFLKMTVNSYENTLRIAIQ